ncbi:unnamed protein product [Agarophyton chilense]
MEYSQKIWTKALRCGNVFPDRRLTSIFVEVLLPAMRAKVRNHLTSHPHIGYDALARYAESYGYTHRSARRQSVRTETPPGTKLITPRSSARKVLSVGTPTDSFDTDTEDGEAILAFGRGISAPSALTTPSSSTFSNSGTYRTAHAMTPGTLQMPPIGTAPPGRFMNRTCRICFSREPNCCQMVPPDVREALLAAWEKNYQLRREEGHCNRDGPNGSARVSTCVRSGTSARATPFRASSSRPVMVMKNEPLAQPVTEQENAEESV